MGNHCSFGLIRLAVLAVLLYVLSSKFLLRGLRVSVCAAETLRPFRLWLKSRLSRHKQEFLPIKRNHYQGFFCVCLAAAGRVGDDFLCGPFEADCRRERAASRSVTRRSRDCDLPDRQKTQTHTGQTQRSPQFSPLLFLHIRNRQDGVCRTVSGSHLSQTKTKRKEVGGSSPWSPSDPSSVGRTAS